MKLNIPAPSPAVVMMVSTLIIVGGVVTAQTVYQQKLLNMAVKTIMTPAEVHPALVIATPVPEIATPSAAPKQVKKVIVTPAPEVK